MKKWLVTGAGLILAACVMSGCGAAEEEKNVDSIAEGGLEEAQDDGTGTAQGTGADSTVLTFGTIYRGYDEELARVIQKYNEQGGPYTVELINYAENTEDFEAVETRYQMDLMSGKGTDIIDLAALDQNSLGTAGILADLYELIPESQLNAYVPNVLSCVDTEGKLYGVGPQFALYTVVANKDKVGEEIGWTMGEMMDIFAENGQGAEALDGFYADESIITTLGKFNLDDYIDWEQGKASFMEEEFYRLLEFDKERRNINEEDYGGPDMRDFSKSEKINQGECLASLEILTSVSHYQIVNEVYSGRAIMKGFPVSEGTGIAIEMYSAIGINANSGKEEAAWDFLKFYLEEWEDCGFFLLNEKFEKQLADAMEQQYTEDGEMIPKDWSDNFEVYAAGEEDVAAVRKAIAMADRECVYNDAVLQIINEEADAFCNGGVSAEKAAENINNRVQLYLDEITSK